jgi:hypothetical protein
MARTLIYLQEQGLTATISSLKNLRLPPLGSIHSRIQMKGLETKLPPMLPCRSIHQLFQDPADYIDYRKAGYSKKFKAEHETDIMLHQAAKRAFDELGFNQDSHHQKSAY